MPVHDDDEEDDDDDDDDDDDCEDYDNCDDRDHAGAWPREQCWLCLCHHGSPPLPPRTPPWHGTARLLPHRSRRLLDALT